jgi:hypothetical protein
MDLPVSSTIRAWVLEEPTSIPKKYFMFTFINRGAEWYSAILDQRDTIPLHLI